MKTLLRIKTGFRTPAFKLSRTTTNLSDSELHKLTMTNSSKKKSFLPSFNTSSSKKRSEINTSLSTQSKSKIKSKSQNSSQQREEQASSQTPSPPKPPPSKRNQAWEKTKALLSSIGEPPTAEYERQQAALRSNSTNSTNSTDSKGESGNRNGKSGKGKGGKVKVKTSGREAFGAVNYGPYFQGGPYAGGGRL